MLVVASTENQIEDEKVLELEIGKMEFSLPDIPNRSHKSRDYGGGNHC
jgi:hypothetical protein